MSSSPSLAEDSPDRQLRNVFTPPLFAGSPVKYRRGRLEIEETVAFLEGEKRERDGWEGRVYTDGASGKGAVSSSEERLRDIKAMSVLSSYNDNLSRDMNTECDNASDASTNAPEDVPGDRFHLEEKSSEERIKHGLKEDEGGGDMSSSYDNIVENGKSNMFSVMLDGLENSQSLFFNDGKRSVDYVLVWESHSEEATKARAYEKRRIFERNLEEEGLQLERECPPKLHGLFFIKIHAPVNVLKEYSEILKLRMPMKESNRPKKDEKMSGIMRAALYISKFSTLKEVQAQTNTTIDKVNACWESFMSKVRVDDDKFPEKKHRLTAIYSIDKEYLFDTTDKDFWTPSIKSRIVQFILDRKRFSNDESDDYALGIERLIESGVYSAAYPLHDGDLKTPGSMRNLLYTEWASVSKCFRYQPLDYVKDYFGVKIGLYFAWLGFYTHMLIPASIVGLICFIYSWSTLYTNQPSEDICHDNSPVKMCPICDRWCDYWNLTEICLHARVTYLFDNPSTVFFAAFMSFWAALFLELWKRYSAEMTHRWDLTGFDVYEEHPRPQYLARLAHVKRKQLNIVTGLEEPEVPFWRMKLPITLFSFSVVCLLVLMAAAAVLGVVIYRASILASLALRTDDDDLITSNALLFTTVTAALINLVLICIFNFIYQYLAEWLTEKELLRTQTEFDDSLTLKIYLLQFVNYYASIFYIAFFKGKFVGSPGKYRRFFGHRQEECSPGGCLTELCIQLAIIMVGKQAFNTVVEMLLPYFYKWWNVIKTIGRKNTIKSPLQWVKDFKLVDFGIRGLFPEYLEMVLQYGFVTIFVSAFPLAPLFALLNNILEMRLDARKLLTCYRRPIPQRVKDIGVWYRILDSIGKFSIITNGFIIAFTSEFIPRLVYRMGVSKDHSLTGYLNYTMKEYNVSLIYDTRPNTSNYTLNTCRFPSYGSAEETDLMYWHILGARLAFVVVFENVVVLVMIIIRWAIPDISDELRDRIRRETYIINTFMMEATKARQQQGSTAAINQSTINKRHEVLLGALSNTPSATLGRSAGCRTAAEDPEVPEPAAVSEQIVGNWDHLLSSELSETDFDLAAHGLANTRRNQSVTNALINRENERTSTPCDTI